MDNTEASFENKSDLDKYGGWLRFFRLINAMYWMVGLFGLISFPLLIFVGFENNQEFIDFFAVFIEVLPGTIMSFLIWRTVLVHKPETPNKVYSLLKFDLALQLLVGAGLYFAYKQDFITEKPVSFLISVIYYFIWAAYFKRSKRVLACYGTNAAKTS